MATIDLKGSIEEKAKLAYQDFYLANKHAFCLGSWEQLTEGQKEHYRKVSNKTMWEKNNQTVLPTIEELKNIEETIDFLNSLW